MEATENATQMSGQTTMCIAFSRLNRISTFDRQLVENKVTEPNIGKI